MPLSDLGALVGDDPEALARHVFLDYLASVRDDVRVLPGHGPATTVGRDRTTNPFLAGTV